MTKGHFVDITGTLVGDILGTLQGDTLGTLLGDIQDIFRYTAEHPLLIFHQPT